MAEVKNAVETGLVMKGTFNVAFNGFQVKPFNEDFKRPTTPGLRVWKGDDVRFINASKSVEARLRSGEMTYAQMLLLEVGESKWIDDQETEQTSYHFCIPQSPGVDADEMFKMLDKVEKYEQPVFSMDYFMKAVV